MIPSLALCLLWLGSALAEPTPSEEDPLSPYRVSFDELAERTIGTASKPVAFNWRRTHVQLATTGSFLFELNNFNSLQGGALVRLPTGGLIVELGLGYAQVWDTASSVQLSYTPYRQPGRPSRVVFEAGLAYPLAEGVVTAAPRWFPAAQLVFNAYAEVEYAIYPGFAGMKAGEVGSALVNPALTDAELDNLEGVRLDAMLVDPGRYGLLLGLGNDLYFEQGLFLSPRMMMAVPVMAPASGSNLLFWAKFSLALGVAF